MTYHAYIVADQIEFESDEFQTLLTEVQRLSSTTRVQTFDELLDSIDASEADPDVVIACQTYKGQFDHVDGERIRRRIPLTQLLLLHGNWCEGETRTGRPVVGFTRISQHEFVARISSARDCSLLPPTASDGELLLEPLTKAVVSEPYRIGVYAAGYDHGLSICESLGSLGFETWRLLREAPETWRKMELDALVWDDVGGCREKRIPLRIATESITPAPTVALLTFPRIQDLRSAKQNGASSILPKPFRVSDLSWCLQSLIRDAAKELRPREIA